MKQQLQEIREQQKETWNKFSSGWKKWDDLTMEWLKPMGNTIIQNLDLESTDTVLDIAAGTGEPGLTIATMLNGGKVIITDLAEDMLSVAREHAAQRGITNIETVACDVCELPFSDNTFDAISCRFGFMFFPDMLLAAKEMVRVLKPGGKLATAVWTGPEKNYWVTVTMDTIKRNVDLPTPEEGSPGIFRCAADGFIYDLFSSAGLKNIAEQEIKVTMPCKTPDVYWNMMTEIAAPVVAGLSKADEMTKAKIKTEVFHALNQKFPDGNLAIDSGAMIISGEK